MNYKTAYLCSNLLSPLFIISFLIKWENHTKADNEISDCEKSHFRWDILFFPTHYEICIQEKALSSLFLVNNQFGPNHKENADLFVILSRLYAIKIGKATFGVRKNKWIWEEGIVIGQQSKSLTALLRYPNGVFCKVWSGRN